MQDLREDFYSVAGINNDVNPFLIKDSQLIACQNFYSHKEFAKKVRFGYAKLSSTTSSGPVRNLIYFDFPNGQRGLLKIADMHVYRYNFDGATWGTPIHTFSVDNKVGIAVLAGKTSYIHMSNGTDDYLVYDGINFIPFPQATSAPFTPRASVLAQHNSRIYGDINKLRLAGSAVDFDLNTPYANDPFKLSNTDAAGGLAEGIDTGNNGKIIDMSTVNGTLYFYKESGVYRYVNYGIQKMNYSDTVIPNTVVNYKKAGYDYFMNSSSIMRNDGRYIHPASDGINTIIQDTVAKLGISNPHAGSWGDYTFFYIGSIQVGDEVIPNGMFVHDERYNEWYVWQLGHHMTCFSTYTDPTTKAVKMISGDDQGNTYVWGEQFSSDDGISIPYRLRTKYTPCKRPESTKKVSRLSTNTSKETGATIGVAKNFEDVYKPIRGDKGGQTSGLVDAKTISRFHTLSLEVSGETSTNRPEYYGYSLVYEDLDDIYGESK
jgi:hypothetical protein